MSIPFSKKQIDQNYNNLLTENSDHGQSSADKNLLILERTSDVLSSKEENGEYVLEGVFGEIDTKNKNQRIYTEAEYLPHVEALQEKIQKSKLLGELDHPAQFEVSLKNVSHIIESLYYDSENKQVRGRIRLLDTDQGRQAKALVDANVPLHISSRAAGRVKNNNEVELQELFTYDLVADPGFESAQLNKVNESLGIKSDNIIIYELDDKKFDKNNDVSQVNNKNQTNQKNMSNEEKYVKEEDFEKYSNYLIGEINKLRSELAEAKKTNVSEGASNAPDQSELDKVIRHNNHLAKTINKLSEHVDNLAEKLDQTIQFSEHVAEKSKLNIDYTEKVAEHVNGVIDYAEHIAEGVNNNLNETAKPRTDGNTRKLQQEIESLKEYSNLIAKHLNRNNKDTEGIKEYTSYLKENIETVGNYANHIAQTINENIVEPQEVGAAGKGISDFEDATRVTQLNTDKDDVENAKSLPRDVDKGGAGKHPRNFAGVRQANYSEDDKGVTREPDQTVPQGSGDGPAKTVVEKYKNDIGARLDKLINESKSEKNKNPHFFKIVSKETQDLYNNLSEDAKTRVRENVSKNGFMTEAQIQKMIENSEKVEEKKDDLPFFIKKMPDEFKETWNGLSESKKNEIYAQAQYRDLKTEYQVKDFWQTRDFREVNEKVNKPQPLNEETKTKRQNNPKTSLGYDPTQYKESLKSRFNK
jgi:hypothetical protein